MGEDNFVKIEGKTLEGEQAYAVFCPECLKDENRKKEVKYVITIGDAEDAIPAQTPYRELLDAGDARAGDDKGLTAEQAAANTQPSSPPPGPEKTGVPAEEATGSGTVVARADAETGTRVAEKKEDTKKKGLFG